MSAGIELKFDVNEWAASSAVRERDLFAKAQAGDDVAASELLFFYAKFGKMSAPEVQSAIEEGAQDVMEFVLATTTIPNARHGAEVHPLMYFGHKKRKTGRKSTRKLLELRHAFGILWSTDEVRKALTTDWAKKTKARGKPALSRLEWPKTIGDVEEELVNYICHHFKDADPETCRRYVRESFPDNPWHQVEWVVAYPSDWELPAQ